jgi:hypothetical protein
MAAGAYKARQMIAGWDFRFDACAAVAAEIQI